MRNIRITFIMEEEQKSRLITEAQETADRLNKLNAFMGGVTFPSLPREDKDLLYSQQRAMSRYVQILGQRIERAGDQFEHAKEAEGVTNTLTLTHNQSTER